MKKLLLILLFFPLLAGADHHRSHALEFLNHTKNAYLRSQFAMERFSDGGEFTAKQQKSINSIFAYISAIQGQVKRSDTYIACYCYDLDAVRRIINQPRPFGPPSALSRASTVIVHMTLLMGSRPDKNKDLAKAIQDARFGWGNLDLAAWHITDAIREEVYNDPDFQ